MCCVNKQKSFTLEYVWKILEDQPNGVELAWIVKRRTKGLKWIYIVFKL